MSRMRRLEEEEREGVAGAELEREIGLWWLEGLGRR
jgi:hypothetical protein